MTEPADTVPSGDSGTARHTEAYCPECGQSFPPDHLRCPNDATRLVRLGGPADPLIGRVFEQRYEVRSRLGEGGMGAVYRGWQLSVDREVAIKVIDPRLSGDRGVVKRFLREARLSSRLSQPSIVNVYDFGQTEDGILYIVMELLRGHTLGTELAAHHAFGVERAVHIAVQLCDALDAAHKQDIVHRDLKPGNVIILDDPPGRDLVKVLDFGLAKSLGRETTSRVTQSDALLGTPLYMSPEQISGQPSDQRVDLYALGCMLHEMLSGAPPFDGASLDRVLSNHLYELAAPLPAGLPPALVGLIHRLIAKHPEDRPQSAAEVRHALLAGETRSLAQTMAPAAPPASSHVVAPPAALPRAVPPGAVPPGVVPPGALAQTQPSSIIDAPRRRWWIGLVALFALGVTAAAILLARPSQHSVTPRSGSTDGSASGATLDAATTAPSAAIDAAPSAAIDAAPLDAGTASPNTGSAAPSLPLDAGRATSRPPRRLPPPVRPEPVDAGSELDFYRSGSGR